MERVNMILTVGKAYKTENTETGEYSYLKVVGNAKRLEEKLGRPPRHRTVDIRFESDGVVVLVETKQDFTDEDTEQLREYVALERAVHGTKKIIGILANMNNDKIRVWQSSIDDAHILDKEQVMDSMEHYKSLFDLQPQNNKETVLSNTYKLNETLHTMGIAENLRSQFVGTVILYIQRIVNEHGISSINTDTRDTLRSYWSGRTASEISAAIKDTLTKFESETFIREADPDIILMNPPYNATPKGIPSAYKMQYGIKAGATTEATKGLVVSNVGALINDSKSQFNIFTHSLRYEAEAFYSVSSSIYKRGIYKSQNCRTLAFIISNF